MHVASLEKRAVIFQVAWALPLFRLLSHVKHPKHNLFVCVRRNVVVDEVFLNDQLWAHGHGKESCLAPRARVYVNALSESNERRKEWEKSILKM